MPRIPDHELERLKRDVSLERLAEGAGVVLKRHGKDLLGLCPFHDDHEPSLVISPEKNLWHCLGACQTGGSVIDWVMKMQGVSFRHAVELLRTDPSLATASRPVKESTVRKLPAPVALNASDQALLNQVIDYYHRTLKQSPEALAYLEQRGLKNSEMIEHFKLGYANRTLGLRLPMKNRKDGAALRGQLQRLGLMRETGHEHFAGSLVVPIFDEAGNVTEVYGRKVHDNLRGGTSYHLYLPGPHQGVWNLEAFKTSEEIILCEALIDALTFWCAGYCNVTASYGTSGFTADHLSAFKQYNTRRVLIAYDRDDAGDGAAQQLAEKLLSEGLDGYRIEFPKGMDANEYARRVTPATKSLGVAIRKAVWLGKGAAPALTTEATSTEELTPVVEAIEPVVTQVKDELTQLTHALGEEPLPSLPASPIPEPPKSDLVASVEEQQIFVTLGDRRYRIRGLSQNQTLATLKMNLLVSRADAFHVDTLELNLARARHGFASAAAKELNVKEDVLLKDLGRLYLKLEALHEQALQKPEAKQPELVTLSENERHDALTLLQDKTLLDRIIKDFDACGVVGEETNKLVGYLGCVSRKLDKPLAVIVQSTSAAGKSSLMDAVLAFMPEEERIQYSAMTGQALYYMGNIDLQHKVLALAEEQGASRAAYALKLLQSEGTLTIASTGKNPETGDLITKEYTVEGPVMIFMTTTAIDLDDELLNRCLVLAVDEDREQTKAIHQRQREAETLEGLIAKEERGHLIKLHQNAQRLLRPLDVVNPYAKLLTFPDSATRTRRDHMKYLAIIRAIALLHQHQREIKTVLHRGQPRHYIEVIVDDIAVANRLAHDVLGRTLDELPPQPRRLLLLLDQLVTSECQKQNLARSDYRFSRRDVREHTKWGDTQLKLHLARLVEMEYVLLHRGGRGQSFVYELLYDGKGGDGKPFVPGLIDIEQLRYHYDANRSGPNPERSGSGRPSVGGQSGGGRSEENNKNGFPQSTNLASCDARDPNAVVSATQLA